MLTNFGTGKTEQDRISTKNGYPSRRVLYYPSECRHQRGRSSNTVAALRTGAGANAQVPRSALGSKITSIYSSTEQKAVDCANILAEHLSLPFVQVRKLGENDRSSTGFLPPDEFELMANEFFANPKLSIRGWERAVDAQQRVASAVEQILENHHAPGIVAIVSHGAVGTLLYCALTGREIDRKWDQPSNGGGNYFGFSLNPREVYSWWRPIDEEF